MPAEPCGTMVVSPALTEGQVDSLLQRQDFYGEHLFAIVTKYLPEDIAASLYKELWAAWNFTQFPEYFGGDERKLIERAARMRDELGGVRPMPNGYRPPDPVSEANQSRDALGNSKKRKGIL